MTDIEKRQLQFRLNDIVELRCVAQAYVYRLYLLLTSNLLISTFGIARVLEHIR